MTYDKKEKDLYFVKLNFHRDLEKLIKENYDLNIKFSDVIAWGYQSVSVYLEDESGNRYTAKVTKRSKEKISKVKRSIELEHYLNDSIPTPKYIKNNNDDYITMHTEDRFIRLQHHIDGVNPFDMDYDAFDQALIILEKIHSTSPPSHINIPKYTKSKEDKLLHGDLTPSNLLISHGKITGILDFEEAILGPVEFDISRFIVFSLYYMDDTTYEELLYHSIEKYAFKKMDKKLLIDISLEHLQERINNLDKNRDKYENLKDWSEDLKITENKVNEIENLKATLSI